jgi:predicted RNA-binding protein YlxR (DUF448 family)
VGCGREAPKAELVRIAIAHAGERVGEPPIAVSDPAATMPGRGAYLCRGEDRSRPADACLATALRRGSIARTLRAPVALDPKLVESVGR